VGLMGLTREVDLKLLNKCFEIDTYDSLLKPEYIDAIRARRQHIVAQQARKEENDKIQAKRHIKESTMRCNIIAQRITLQEYLISRSEDFMKQLDDLSNNEEEAKNLNLDNIRAHLLDNLMEGYRLENPDDFFKDQPDNIDLVSNIQTEFEFFISTLEIFGLPENYMLGKGHWSTWSKE